MSKIFFISDLHLGHFNVIKYDNRPFFSVEDMNNNIIERWNSVVSKDDIVYVLGDMIWKSEFNNAVNIIKKLNGKIILIKGNHDTFIRKNNIEKLLEIKDYDDLYVTLTDGSQKRVILSHYYIPFYNGHTRGAIMLHGHSHMTKEAEIEINIDKELNIQGLNVQHINVGCMYDYMNYTPRTLDELISILV